jgi:hypothetical protein
MPTQRLTSELAVVHDIRDYGSNVGGGGDDQPAIAAACAAAARSGAPVFVPAGTFLVGAETALPSSVTLLGTGRASVIRALPRPGGLHMFSCAAGSSGQTLRSLHLDGHRSAQEPARWAEYAGLFALDPRRLRIEGCTFTGHPYACVIARAASPDAGDVRILDSEFTEYGYSDPARSATAVILDALPSGRLADVSVRGNWFRGGRSGQLAALAIQNADRVEVVDNRVHDQSSVYAPGFRPAVKGIDITGSTDVRLCRNEALDVVDQHWIPGGQDSDSGVQVGFAFAAIDCRRVVIAQNIAHRVCAGIGAFDVTDFTIAGNVVVGNPDGDDRGVAAGCGLEVNSNVGGRNGPFGGTITGNTFRNLRTGIFVAYGRDLIVAGNVVSNIQKTGLNLVQGQKRGVLVANNIVRDVGRLGNANGGPYYGISLGEAGSVGVMANIVESSGDNLPLHSIAVDARSWEVRLRDNLTTGCTRAPVTNRSGRRPR